MSARVVFPCVATAALVCSCAMLPPKAEDFERSIAWTQRTAPASPAELSAQLAYAEFLVNAAPGPCTQRLPRAQQQLDRIDANPKTHVMFPDGWARAAGLEYQLQVASATCGGEVPDAADLAHAAVTARRAAELYRNAFDYRSMVAMQGNVADVLHQLGDSAAATAALESALDMDREFGFEDDARENYKLLLTWQAAPAADAQLERLMQDFPKRSVALTFAWHASDAQASLDSERKSLHDGEVADSHAAVSFLVSVRASGDKGGWSVSHSRQLASYQPGVWPTLQREQAPAGTFVPGAPPPADFKVSAAGDFDGFASDTGVFSAQLVAKTEELIRNAMPPGKEARRLTEQAVQRTGVTLSPAMLEGSTTENYQLGTAMWIGATLEQGVWYQTAAPLSLAGLPGVLVPHRISFAFTRMVPCTQGAPTPACVELVVHAVPEPQALEQVIDDAGIAAYSASSDYRLVTDPATLLPYSQEERLGWYASRANRIVGSDLGSDHFVSVTSYGVRSPEPGPL